MERRPAGAEASAAGGSRASAALAAARLERRPEDATIVRGIGRRPDNAGSGGGLTRRLEDAGPQHTVWGKLRGPSVFLAPYAAGGATAAGGTARPAGTVCEAPAAASLELKEHSQGSSSYSGNSSSLSSDDRRAAGERPAEARSSGGQGLRADFRGGPGGGARAPQPGLAARELLREHAAAEDAEEHQVWGSSNSSEAFEKAAAAERSTVQA